MGTACVTPGVTVNPGATLSSLIYSAPRAPVLRRVPVDAGRLRSRGGGHLVAAPAPGRAGHAPLAHGLGADRPAPGATSPAAAVLVVPADPGVPDAALGGGAVDLHVRAV